MLVISEGKIQLCYEVVHEERKRPIQTRQNLQTSAEYQIQGDRPQQEQEDPQKYRTTKTKQKNEKDNRGETEPKDWFPIPVNRKETGQNI